MEKQTDQKKLGVLLLLISTLFVIPSYALAVEIQPSYQYGADTLTVPEECRSDNVYISNVKRTGTNTWEAICEERIYREDKYGNKMDISPWIVPVELIRQKKTGNEPEQDTVLPEENTDGEMEENTTEAGTFFGWMQNATTGIKTFFQGEVLCKNEPLAPMKKGSITSIEGRVGILRSIRRLPAEEGAALLAGDIVIVHEESSATVELYNTGVLLIHAKTKLQIPKTRKKCARNQLITTIKQMFSKPTQWIIEKIRGESYEVKTPSSAAGVRG